MFSWAARTSANSPGIISGGLLSTADLQVTAPVSGMSVNIGAGECLIGGNEGASQGGYYARATSTTNVSVAAANPSNPRIDAVVATVADNSYTAPSDLSGNQWSPVVVTGTPTSGANLTNLSGAPAIPGSSLLLAWLLVPAAASNIITADIANVATQALGQFQPLNPHGFEWSYTQVTAPVNVTGTTEAAPTTIISPAAFTPDGAPVLVEFFAPYIGVPTAAVGSVLQVALYEGATEITRLVWAQTTNTAATSADTVFARYRFTPTATAHTYTLAAFVSSTTGTPQIGAGPGGSLSFPPAFLRFTKA